VSGETLFGRIPLAAGFCLGAALLFRLLVGRHDRDVQEPRVHRGRLRIPEVGLLGVCAGHAVMLAWPARVLAWNRSADRLLAFEVVFFVFGLIALAGVLGLVVREMLVAPRGASGSLLDTMSLALLLVAVVSGLALAVRYRWASSWSSITLTPAALPRNWKRRSTPRKFSSAVRMSSAFMSRPVPTAMAAVAFRTLCTPGTCKRNSPRSRSA
jgi:hypothetical protein